MARPRARSRKGRVYSGTRRLEPATPLARKIQERLEELNWPNDELAKRMDVHKQRVSLWTTGKVAPSALSLSRIAKILGTTVEKLMDGTVPEEATR